MQQYDLEVHLKKTYSSSGRPSGSHPAEKDGTVGGGRTQFDPYSREHRPTVHIIYILFGRSAF